MGSIYPERRIERSGFGLAEFTVFCSWTRQFILTVPLSTKVHKWISENGLPSHQTVMVGWGGWGEEQKYF